MDYNSMLKVVKNQNPDMPFKEQQKKASEMLKEFKKASEALGSGDLSHATKPAGNDEKLYPEYDPNSMPQKRATMAELVRLEKSIRESVIDKNRLILMSRQIMPEGHLETHGKDGVNTLCTFEDGYGNKVPIVGYFKIFI